MFKKYFKLFFSFLKIGAFTFGSGYAMITLIKKEICDNRGWMTEKNISDIIAISESTPGSISISSSTFIGYRVGGFLGAVIATIGIVLPSALIMTLVSFFMNEFASNIYVDYAFMGIRCAILVLIINAAYMLYRIMDKYTLNYLEALLSFAAIVFFRVNVIFIIVADIVLNLFLSRYALEDLQ